MSETRYNRYEVFVADLKLRLWKLLLVGASASTIRHQILSWHSEAIEDVQVFCHKAWRDCHITFSLEFVEQCGIESCFVTLERA